MSERPTVAERPTVVVGVDQFVVEGASLATARRVAAGFEGHLASLLAERGVPAGLERAAERSDLALPPVAGRPERPEAWGRALATALWDRLDGVALDRGDLEREDFGSDGVDRRPGGTP